MVCDSLRGDRPAPPAHALQSLGVAGAPGYSALHAEGDANIERVKRVVFLRMLGAEKFAEGTNETMLMTKRRQQGL